jgi:class 3 adenylate cyclase/CheY-like chemotaxis protein
MSADGGAKPAGPPTRDANAQARHDLRTPVNQILGYAELLEEELEDRGLTELIPDLKKIQTAAKNQIELINRVLAPPEAGTTAAPAAGPATMTQLQAEAPTLTVAVAGAEAPAPVSQDEVPTAPSFAGSPVLVVDDNEMNRDMLSRRLEGRGYAVAIAENGQRALDLIAEQPFDTVILDVMMPGINGLEVLRRVRQTKSMSDLPIIMATARDASEDVVAALRLGANDYVTKPLDFQVVLARLSTQLALKRQKDEIRRLADNLEKRNQFIRNTFGRYLSDEVVASLLETPEGLKLGGELKRVTILMSDLRGFTQFSERLGPNQVMYMLNRYLGTMAEIILRQNGTIDEFIGDAILAIFGAPITRPDDAQRAMSCAIQMQLAMDVVNELNENDGLPRLEMGIAIHTGDVVVGNIGSDRRAKYGVVGPPVNIAGRIESYTVGGQILVSGQALDQAGVSTTLGERMDILAKGAKAPIAVYPLRGLGTGEDALQLPEHRDVLVALASPVAVRCWMLEGKHVGGDVFDGELVKLSKSEAVLRTDGSVAVLTNLKISLLAESGAERPGGDVYVKVLELGKEGALLHFTSVPPEIQAVLDALIAPAS